MAVPEKTCLISHYVFSRNFGGLFGKGSVKIKSHKGS